MKLLPLLILFLSHTVTINAQQWNQNTTETKADFKIKNIGMYANGSFAEVAIESNLNTENLKGSYINGIIKVNSINTRNKKRDKHLLANDFFDASKYPNIKLVSTKIEKTSTNHYKLTAKLTIKETTKRIVIPLEISENDASIVIKSNFNLNRRDYNVGGSSWVLSNTVKIQVVYTAKK